MECYTAISRYTGTETDHINELLTAAYQFKNAQFPPYETLAVSPDMPGLRLYRSLDAPWSDRIAGIFQLPDTTDIDGPLGSWPSLPARIVARQLVDDPTISIDRRLFLAGTMHEECVTLYPTGLTPLTLVVENPGGRLTATYYPCGDVRLVINYQTPRDEDVQHSWALPAPLSVPSVVRTSADEFDERWLVHCTDLVKEQWAKFDRALSAGLRQRA